MVGCSAPNCSNSSDHKNLKKKRRVFRFPKDPNRRQRWIINCRRDCWTPNDGAYLCEDHFEANQFELKRIDNWKKLKPNAVPTLFNVPNPPKLLTLQRVKDIGLPKIKNSKECMTSASIPLSSSEVIEGTNTFNNLDIETLQQKVLYFQAENSLANQKLKNIEMELKKYTSGLEKFLSRSQTKNLLKDPGSGLRWNDDDIIKGLKLRFALSKHGYNYLLQTGYPAPSCSTLNRRIQGIKVPYGTLHEFINLLRIKAESMSCHARDCILSFDEMEISSDCDYDTSTRKFVGNTTLGSSNEGKHYTVLLLRGLTFPWKQIVAHEITGVSTSGEDMWYMLKVTVNAVRSAGFNVMATVSDMGSNNKALWKHLGIKVSRKENKFKYKLENDTPEICCIADVRHLLKNMKKAVLSQVIRIPPETVFLEDLDSDLVMGSYVKELWIKELESETSLRSLHHISKKHLFPTRFQSRNVALAVQFFSIKTAAALEKAVMLKILPVQALTTAWWIRFIHQWFEIMTARCRKKAITSRNKDQKISFLKNVVDIIGQVRIGKGWKPLNTGIKMSTLSIIDLCSQCFEKGYGFFLAGRTTQNALENVFSQVRRKSGAKPSALKTSEAIKLICVSQYLSGIKKSNYATDTDKHLLDVSKLAKRASSTQKSSVSLKIPMYKTDMKS